LFGIDFDFNFYLGTKTARS